MIRCTLQDILQATGGELLQGENIQINGVTTDSRHCEEKQLFIPLVGENFDGHDYIDVALNKGCAGCLTSKKDILRISGKFYIYVEDTLLALKNLAIWYRKKFRIPFIQITGSAGKTTTKEMVAEVLSQYYRTFRTEANYNNAIGVPQMILKLSRSDEAAVIETGMNHFREIAYLGEIVRPSIAVITNIGDAHIENLGNSREGVFKAKCEIFENLQETGMAILNGDDEELCRLKAPVRNGNEELLKRLNLPKKTLFFGRTPDCDIHIEGIRDFGAAGVRFRITTKRSSYTLRLRVPGAYLAYAASVAIAVGEELGLTEEEILEGINNFKHVGNRMNVIKTDGERIIIDDCYNANPQAMKEALKTLSLTPVEKHIAILGDMGELGDLTTEAHKELGNIARDLDIDVVIAIGEKIKAIQKSGNRKVLYFIDFEEAKKDIAKHFTPGTACLVKASHAMHFEKIVSYLQLCKVEDSAMDEDVSEIDEEEDEKSASDRLAARLARREVKKQEREELKQELAERVEIREQELTQKKEAWEASLQKKRQQLENALHAIKERKEQRALERAQERERIARQLEEENTPKEELLEDTEISLKNNAMLPETETEIQILAELSCELVNNNPLESTPDNLTESAEEVSEVTFEQTASTTEVKVHEQTEESAPNQQPETIPEADDEVTVETDEEMFNRSFLDEVLRKREEIKQKIDTYREFRSDENAESFSDRIQKHLSSLTEKLQLQRSVRKSKIEQRREEIAEKRIEQSQHKESEANRKKRLEEKRKQKRAEAIRSAKTAQMVREARRMDEEMLLEDRQAKDVLCLYYSRTGNTRRTMKEIGAAIDADMVAITDSRNRNGMLGYLRCGMDAMRTSTLPTTKISLLQPLSEYKLVIIGTPVWSGRCASPIRSFLKRQGLELNTVGYVVVRNGIRKHETVFAQLDMYTSEKHVLEVSLRPGDEGYTYWKNNFVHQVKEYLENQYAGKVKEN